MDPDIQNAARTERKVIRSFAALAAVFMLWSLLSTPNSQADDGKEIQEPESLSAYYTIADAMPVQSYLDHQVYQIAPAPALAHSQTEVGYPSEASGIAWLVDAGIANGLHGTTTGNKVPTESSAKQPGGEPKEEFSTAGGPIGSDATARVQAGRSIATAEQSDRPTGYANSYLGNLWVFPAAGSPKDPPGTLDPDATYPGGEPGVLDPAPRGQMAILSIGSISSTSESFRSGDSVRSIGVAELKDINLGNRTSDNRCTNCFRIDKVRAEAVAEANGQPGGARAKHRVTMTRMCRRSFDATTSQETDFCPTSDTSASENSQMRNAVDYLNDQFEHPVWRSLEDTGLENTMVGIRMHANATHESPTRSDRTVSPRDDPKRNYSEAEENGQTAKAVAEGLDIELWTITTSQFIPSDEDISNGPAKQLIDALDQEPDISGVQISGPDDLPGCEQLDDVYAVFNAGTETRAASPPHPCGQLTVSTSKIRAIRRLHLTLGVAMAAATARPGFGSAGTDDDGTTAPGLPEIKIPEVQIPEINIPPFTGGGSGGGGTTVVSNGLGAGRLMLKIDWASTKVKPWPAKDVAGGTLSGGIMTTAWLLLKRRRLLGA